MSRNGPSTDFSLTKSLDLNSNDKYKENYDAMDYDSSLKRIREDEDDPMVQSSLRNLQKEAMGLTKGSNEDESETKKKKKKEK